MGRERRERKSEGRKERREENRRWTAASSPPAWVSEVRRGERRWGNIGEEEFMPSAPRRLPDSIADAS